MTEKKDPTKPVSNDEKFKPQNVKKAGGAGDPGKEGRKAREMNQDDIPRGSEGDVRRSSGQAR